MIVDRCTAHADRESDAVRKTMLCTALRDEPEFLSLQHQDNIFQAQGNSPITYDNYLTLLRSTAFNIDSRHTGKPRRQANTANQTSSSSSSHNKGGHGKGGASHGSKGGNSTSNRISVPKEIWSQLPPDARQAIITKNKSQYQANSSEQENSGKILKALWDQLPPNARKAIASSNKSNRSSNQSRQAAPQDSAYISETTIATTTTTPPSPSTQFAISPSQASNQTLLNNLLSNARSDNSERVISSTGAIYQRVSGSGSTRSINMASVTYRCTQAAASTTLPGSLIDGEANGGLAGEDIRVLSYTDRSADITGIGDSHMEDVPIVTCAGVVQTTRGPIVIIMNQYAYYGKGSTVHSTAPFWQYG